MGLEDEIPEHLFRYFKISYDTIFHRPDGSYVSRCPSQHVLSLFPNGEDLLISSGIAIDCYNRGFIRHNPLSLDVNQGIGRAKVNGQISGK